MNAIKKKKYSEGNEKYNGSDLKMKKFNATRID